MRGRALMRAWLVIGIISAAAACGESTPSSPDLAMAVTDQSMMHDLATAGGDMAPLSCAALLDCITLCTAVNANTCVQACLAMASPAALPYFNTLSGCAQPVCSAGDAAAPPCADPSAPGCLTCVSNACPTQL